MSWCWQEATSLLYGRPRLWIRLSECCIQHHQKSVDLKCASSGANDLVKLVVGGGKDRRVLLQTALTSRCGRWEGGASPSAAVGEGDEEGGRDGKAAVTGAEAESDGEAVGSTAVDVGASGAMSLQYAKQCLENALNLISRDMALTSGDAAAGGAGMGAGIAGGGAAVGSDSISVNGTQAGFDTAADAAGDGDVPAAAVAASKESAAVAENGLLKQAVLAKMVRLCVPASPPCPVRCRQHARSECPGAFISRF